MTFDPENPEWDDMVDVWESALTSDSPDVVEAVKRMRDTWERFESVVEPHRQAEGDRGDVAIGQAWKLEALSCAAIVAWKAGNEPAGRVVMRVNAVTEFYEKKIGELGSN